MKLGQKIHHRLIQQVYGGGSEALPATAPSPLIGAALSTTEITNWWIGTGADSYELQRDEVQVYSGTDKTFADTGLTANTTYEYRVRATKGGLISDWATFSVKTLSVVPLHAYDFRGIPYDSSNGYGATGSPATASQVREIYSYRGTANTLTPTAGYGLIHTNATSALELNKQLAYTRIAPTGFYTPATNIDLSTGDFTILIETSKNNLGAVLQNIMNNSGDTNTFMSLNTSGARLRFGTITNYTPLWPSALGSYNNERLIVKLSGTSLYAGKMSDSGTVSFGAPVTISRTSFIIDRLFNSGDQYRLAIFNFYQQALSDAQIVEEFNRASQSTYSFEALDKTLAPKGISTWSDLTSGYFIDADTAFAATSGASWAGIYTIGGYSCVRLIKKDSLLQDFLKFYRHSDSKISEDILLGTPGAVADGHNVSSIFPLDNTWYVFEQDIHYDKTQPTNLVIKRFGKDYDMSEYTTLPKANGIVSHMASYCQYPQVIKTANYLHIIVQEWNGSQATWTTDFRSKDGGNTFEKIRIAYTGGSNWFYHTVIHSEDDKVRVMLHYLLIGATDRYAHTSYIETADDFDNVYNVMYGFDTGGAGAFTKAISANSAPLTVAELTTNFLMTHDGSADSDDCRVTSAYYDPTDGKVYACALDGSDTGFDFIHSVNGVWTEVSIDLLAHSIITNYGEVGAIGHGTNIPTIVRTGANAFTLACQEIVSGAIWKVVEFSTTDTWATSAFVGDITDDETTNHDRIMVTRNIHHTGGASAYSEKRLLACSREQTVPDNHSDTFFHDISG